MADPVVINVDASSIKTAVGGMAVGIQGVMNNLGHQAPEMMSVVAAFAYTAGIFFVFMGIDMMTKSANQNSRAAYSGHGFVWSIGIGILLFSLPETMSYIGGTFFAGIVTTNPLDYQSQLQGKLGTGDCKLNGIRPLLMLFGYVAVIRGLMVFRSVGMHGGQGKDTVWKGVVLCPAGLFLVHMRETLMIINATTGLKIGEGLC